MGRSAKDPAKRIHRQKPKEVDPSVLNPAFPDGVPDPPEGLSPQVEDWWFGYFASGLARAIVQPSDLMALRRLAELYEMRSQAYRLGRAEPLVTGGHGSVSMHPARAEVLRLEATIRPLEDRFGLTPRARHALGVQLVGAAKSIEDLTLEAHDA